MADLHNECGLEYDDLESECLALGSTSAHALPDWIQSNIYSNCILLLRQKNCRRDSV